MGAWLRDGHLPQPQPRLDHLVPRPRHRHDPAQRLRRAGGVLHRARRPGRHGARHANGRGRGAPGTRPQGGRRLPLEQDLLRDPDRHPGPHVQRRRFAVLPRHADLLRRDHRTLPPGRRRRRDGLLADLEPRVLREHDDGQRQHLAVPGRPAAPLPVPLPQRLRFALPDPRLHRGSRGRGVADRQRGRVPPRTGQSDRDERQPAAPGPGRARRPHRGLHEGAARQPRAAQRRPRRALRRWRPVDFPMADPATTGRIMQFRVGPALAADPTTPPQLSRAAGDRRDAAGDPHPVTGADRGDGHGRRRHRRGSRGPGCGERPIPGRS